MPDRLEFRAIRPPGGTLEQHEDGPAGSDVPSICRRTSVGYHHVDATVFQGYGLHAPDQETGVGCPRLSRVLPGQLHHGRQGVQPKRRGGVDQPSQLDSFQAASCPPWWRALGRCRVGISAIKYPGGCEDANCLTVVPAACILWQGAMAGSSRTGWAAGRVPRGMRHPGAQR